MRALALRSGQLLNKSEVAKETGINSKTADKWLNVLVASNQVTLLEPWFGESGKTSCKDTQGFFSTMSGCCVFCWGLGGQTVTESYLVGAVWETFVFCELRKYLSLAAPEATIWYYRDQSRETDFIIEKDGFLTLAEAKWKELPTPRDFAQALKVHELLGRRARWPVMVLCRTRQSFPVTEKLLAVNAFRLSGTLGMRSWKFPPSPN